MYVHILLSVILLLFDCARCFFCYV